MKGKVEYKPLSEERAVEIGSEILGETFLYSMAAAYIVYEYWRSMKKGQRNEDFQNLEISDLQKQTQRLEHQMLQLQQTFEALQSDLRTHLDSNTDSTNDASQQPSKSSKSWWIF